MSLFAGLVIEPEEDDQPCCDYCDMEIDGHRPGFQCPKCGEWYHNRCGRRTSDGDVCRFCSQEYDRSRKEANDLEF